MTAHHDTDQTDEATVQVGERSDRGSGWPFDAKERGDFLHPPRSMPAEVRNWRDDLVKRVRAQPGRFPAVPVDASTEEVRSRVDDGIAFMREIARITDLLHGTPRLGNQDDPVDELVYIVLSRKTREEAYQRSFRNLKAAFPKWDDLLKAPRQKVFDLVLDGGLPDKKTDSLFGSLGRIKEEFGSVSLAPARDWSNERLEEFFCSLPEISRKTAYCIMMYSMGREVFPVDTHVGRTLARLGPYRELGLDLSGLDHKQLQVVLADLVPPNLRYSLHVNLLVHGREICIAGTPRCGECDLRKFCKTYRAQRAAEVRKADEYNAIDLFAGAGGLSRGFERAGVDVVASLDLDEPATRTYRFNHPSIPAENVFQGDVRELSAAKLKKVLDGRKLDILAGAPPCQGFSLAGFRSKKSKTGYKLKADARNFLFENLVSLAVELRPRLFLMENVPGMETAKKDNTTFIDAAAQILEEEGFKTTTWKINATEFGVPQDRTRMFLIGALGVPLPLRPVGEYQNVRKPEQDPDGLPPVRVSEAIFDLPPRAAGTGMGVDRKPVATEEDRRQRRYLSKQKLLNSPRLVYNHFVRYHNERDLELYALLRPGEDSVHAIEVHGRPDLMRYRRDVFDDKYARLRPDRPSKTIVAHLAKDGNGYIHPEQVRSISIREAARLQGFDDDYVFCGSPSDQWVQIGNAVSPIVGEAIARSFLAVLRREDE
jgi:DNA (cytosine-5)-methyltransferase 1